MSLKWKNFFYFQKNDKNAIILLLLLIVMCGGLLIGLDNLKTEENETAQREVISEFESFIQTPANNVEHNNDESEPLNFLDNISSKNNTKVSTKKLTEGETIDLNTASVAAFKRIPGVGDEYAKRMYDYRKALGGFTSANQLKEIKGFTGKRFDKIAPYVVIKSKHKLLKVNNLSKDKLLIHPYLSEKQVEKILDIRSENKRIESFDDLLKTVEFKPRDKDRLNEYLSFD